MSIRFSIIVPAYNEEADLPKTLTALEVLKYHDYEVLVIDDGSDDNTIAVAQTFVNRDPNHFQIFRQSQNQGVASARNRGIREARGNVLVILNADVLLPTDYLSKLSPFYEQGNQWVAVRSQVLNLTSPYSRFTAAEEYSYYFVEKKFWVWTEGFSCTKEAAVSVGLFPEVMPGCSGEDVDFGLLLEKKLPGTRTTEIVAPHVAPDTFSGYWGQQKGRGKGRSNYYYYMNHYRLRRLFISSVLATIKRLVKVFLGQEVLTAWRLSRFSPRRRKDFLPFIWVGIVREFAMIAGIWSAYRRIGKTDAALAG